MAEEPNVLIVQIDGPNLVTGNVEILAPSGVRALSSAMLCRCGQSLDKPFCDGAHVKCGFSDRATLPSKIESSAVPHVPLPLRPL